METINIGIIICDRYRRCSGGKCFRAIRGREGAFQRYVDKDVEVVGYTSCDGCPGGNIEYAVDEMIANGAEAIHLATGLLVGYPPCPYITQFRKYISEKYKVNVVIGTHPIPESYFTTHCSLGTWESEPWEELIHDTVCNKSLRLSYD